jgi:hypothetical protein
MKGCHNRQPFLLFLKKILCKHAGADKTAQLNLARFIFHNFAESMYEQSL